jgi:hypothetical protein
MKKGGQDVIYADEWPLKNQDETDILIKEANLIDAKGAGITGGDPLMVPERTTTYIRLLKETYGPLFHIHLYTSGLVHADAINDFAAAGLDEIRFHPMPDEWDDMDDSKILSAIQQATNTSMDVAIEIPVLPRMKHQIIKLIRWANSNQIKWINLNELEFSERNETPLRLRGLIEKHDLSAAVQNSQETAYQIIKTIDTENLDIGVHYCSSSFKDAIQLKNRMKRRAKNIKTPIDLITDDATILKGIVEHPNKKKLEILLDELKKTQKLTQNDFCLDEHDHRLYLPIPLLEQIAHYLVRRGYTCFISEQYPTHDHLEVERIPLPLKIEE